jgi:hypothetical protein
LAVALLGLVVACRDNPNYCAGHVLDNCNLAMLDAALAIDAAPDGPSLCTSNTQCSGTTSVCESVRRVHGPRAVHDVGPLPA